MSGIRKRIREAFLGAKSTRKDARAPKKPDGPIPPDAAEAPVLEKSSVEPAPEAPAKPTPVSAPEPIRPNASPSPDVVRDARAYACAYASPYAYA